MKCHHSDCPNESEPDLLFCADCAAKHANENPRREDVIFDEPFHVRYRVAIWLFIIIVWSAFFYFAGREHGMARLDEIERGYATAPRPANPVDMTISKPITDAEIDAMNYYAHRAAVDKREVWSLTLRYTGGHFEYCVTRTHVASNAMHSDDACERTLRGAVDAIGNDWNIEHRKAPTAAPTFPTSAVVTIRKSGPTP